jgi:hypothetical protein
MMAYLAACGTVILASLGLENWSGFGLSSGPNRRNRAHSPLEPRAIILVQWAYLL